MAEKEQGHASFGAIIATIGSILIAIGVARLLALNWADIPSALKIFILVFATVCAFIAGVMFRTHDYVKIGGSLLMLGSLLYTLSVFLIAQIFSTSVSVQGTAWLLLISWIGVAFVAYVFSSSASLVVALFEFFGWISFQYFSFVRFLWDDSSIGILAITYLAVAVGLYGLTQFHKSKNHEFANVYRYWTAFYVLTLAYILSFQIILPIMWGENFEISAGLSIFLTSLSLLSIIIVVFGTSMAMNQNKTTGKEVFGFVALLVLYIVLIGLTALFSGERLFEGLSTGLWIMWIFDNILFIFVILSVIGYGVNYKSPKLVNLAMGFFVLDIITRYLGFFFDFGGYVGFAVMAIIGGIILIFGGWGIEMWRKRLIEKTTERGDVGYSVY